MKNVCALICISLLIITSGCKKNSTVEQKTENNTISSSAETAVQPDNISKVEEKPKKVISSNPRKALYDIGFWHKEYFVLEHNPIYGYCYQNLFPVVDTSQEEDVIAFNLNDAEEQYVIFVVDSVRRDNNIYVLSGSTDTRKAKMYVKPLDDRKYEFSLDGYNFKEVFDIDSGLAYSSFTKNDLKKPYSELFDLTKYITCEEMDNEIMRDVSNRLTDESVKTVSGFDTKTDKGYDCWGKWSRLTDGKNVYYELDKENHLLIDYSDTIYSSGETHKSVLESMSYKNGIFFFNFEDSEMIGYICIPIDNNTAQWILDDVNLGVYSKINN